MKLMIVDDSLIIRNMINRSLMTRFSKVIRADNGKQAVNLAQRERPDVVTMDLTMPHMNGVEATKAIIRNAPGTHILVVSALADKATAIQALTLGANGFLCKPFTEAEIDAAIERILKVGTSS